MKQALVLYGATELGPPHFSGDILWRTGFKAPDPFPLVEIEGRTYLLLSPLELERAEKEARADEIIPIMDYIRRLQNGTDLDATTLFLEDQGVTHVIIPASFPYDFGKLLESKFAVEVRKPPFYPGRARKTDWEIGEIEKAQRAVEGAVSRAREFLEGCRIEGDLIYCEKRAVTSELLRKVIDDTLFAQGFFGVDTIVASGIQAADPHCIGSGPLFARSAIVLDVFPLSISTHYYADQTRTVFKGEPSKELKDMYQAVLEAQLGALARVKAGMNGKEIHEWVVKFFESKGYPRDIAARPMEGFFHGVGHGVGIDIHEPPLISGTPCVLEERNVVTVEPGLYYSRARGHIPAGGIRIEDMVVVERDGCRNLTKMPKDFDWAIIP